MSQSTILVIEDERTLGELLVYNLKKEGYEVQHATDGQDGLRRAQTWLPDLVILDLMLPVIEGLEVCRQLKAGSRTRNIPILILTARSEEVDEVVGFQMGADDYVTKPFKIKALLQRVRVAASETERLRQGLRDAQRRAQTLESIVATQARALIDLQSRAAMDPLTQICNRGAFDQALVAYVERAHSMNRPLSLVVLDIDHFKKVNDQWGHPAGDEVLRKVAASLHEHVREGDVIARLGGEELAVLLERANLKAAFTAADRMRQSIGALSVPILDEAGQPVTAITVTVSGGVAQLRAREDGHGLYRRADMALYKAKQSGRNQVVVEQPTRPPG